MSKMIGSGQEYDASLEIKEKKDTYFKSSALQKARTVTDDEINAVDERMREVSEKAMRHDTLSDRLEQYTTAVQNNSSWLKDRKIPDKKTIGKEIDKAAATIGISELSSSQRSKRGKRFTEKARQQAQMINLTNKCRWKRDEALEDLMKHGENTRLGYDEIFPYVKHEKKIIDPGLVTDRPREEVLKGGERPTYMKGLDENLGSEALIMKDLSFYYELKARNTEMTEKVAKSNPKVFRYDVIEKIADKDKRDDGYREVLKEFKQLDLSQFDYKSNEDFMDNEDQSFERRYAALRAFSHVPEMLKKLKNLKVDPIPKKMMQEYQAKAETLQEILKDYEARIIMLQSPYYTLLAGKDLNSFSDKELKERMGKTEDPLISAYIGVVLEKRQKQGFGKGSKAKSIYEKKLKTIKSGKAAPELSLEEYVERNSTMFYFRKNTDIICQFPPFLYSRKDQKAMDDKAEHIRQMHEQLMATTDNEESSKNYIYRKIDDELYTELVRNQQLLEYTGSQVRELWRMKKTSVGARADEIDELIVKLTEKEEFKKTQKEFLEEAEQMEQELEEWKAENLNQE